MTDASALRATCRALVDDVPEGGLEELLEDIMRIIEFYTERLAYLQRTGITAQSPWTAADFERAALAAAEYRELLDDGVTPHLDRCPCNGASYSVTIGTANWPHQGDASSGV